MDLKNKFKAIYNPYTRHLIVRYGNKLHEHFFQETEEWVAFYYTENTKHSKYFLHVQLDYDESLQLLFYPRKDEDESLNEGYGSYYDSALPQDKSPKNIILVTDDLKWKTLLDSNLEYDISELLMLVKDYVHNAKYISGLCSVVLDLYDSGIITSYEYTILDNYIKHNRPSMLSSWSAYEARFTDWYWVMGKKEPRIKWLDKHIKRNN